MQGLGTLKTFRKQDSQAVSGSEEALDLNE
jgi:hypothetical protein